MTRRAPWSRIAWLAIYAAGMGLVEAAVVVYLRAIYYPGGFSFPITIIPDTMAAIEVGREAATILMLGAVAIAAGEDRWERFLMFCATFGAWDIFYYVWLRVFLGWPPSLMTWDILFLIPVPWIGPVLAPVIVSAGLIGGAIWLLRLREAGSRLGFSWWQWGAAIAGGLIVLLAFTIDHGVVLRGDHPPPFRWGLFASGVAAGAGALVSGVRSMPGPGR